jgi:pyruvate dehydrogenase E1 component beta subunit
VAVSNPLDAYWMIQQAITLDDPVLFFEPKRRYWDKAEVDEDGSPALPLAAARVVQAGTHATVVAYGPMVRTCLDAAAAAAEEGRSIELIDLRSLSPLDMPVLHDSVRKTGRCVVVHEAQRTLGVGAEIAARVTEECFYSLEAPVLRVTGYDTPYPPARVEEEYLPDLDRVLDGVDRVLAF